MTHAADRPPRFGSLSSTAAVSRAAWIAVAGLAGLMVWTQPVNHDAAWYLHMVGVWLDGGTPYVDVVDTNPPLILLLTLPPAWIARLTGLGAIPLFQVYVFTLAVLSALASARLVRIVLPEDAAPGRGALVTALLFVLLPFAKADYGQREHLAVIATVPYVVLAAARMLRRPVSGPMALLIGIAGGIGFAIKPHFLLAWAVIEAVVWWHRRDSGRSPDSVALTAAGVFAAYGLVVLVAFPQYLVVADEVRRVYGGINSPPMRLVELHEVQAGLLALAVVLLVRLPRSESALPAATAAAAAGFLAASLAQLKGWGYHLYPAQVYLVLFFVVTILAVLSAAPELAGLVRGGVAAIALAVVAAALLSSVKYVVEARTAARGRDLVSPLARFVHEYAPHGTIAVLGMRTLVYPAFPLVNETGVRWSLRHNALWFLPAFYERELLGPSPDVPFRAPGRMPPLERKLFDEIVSDLCATPPDLLIVEVPAHFAPAGRRALDLIAYYRQDERFNRLFQSFRQVGSVPPFAVFDAGPGASCGSGADVAR